MEKTGHLTGTNPKGRTDWFVGYAKDSDNNTVALAAITVNIKKWTVKSSSLAEMMFRKHFKYILNNKNKNVVNQPKGFIPEQVKRSKLKKSEIVQR